MINQHKNYFKKIPSPKFFKFKNRSLANEKQKERERGGEKKNISFSCCVQFLFILCIYLRILIPLYVITND